MKDLIIKGPTRPNSCPDYQFVVKTIYTLATLWPETLINEEFDLYESAVAISHALIAETYSNQIITPGVTTLDDLYWHYRQRMPNSAWKKPSAHPF